MPETKRNDSGQQRLNEKVNEEMKVLDQEAFIDRNNKNNLCWLLISLETSFETMKAKVIFVVMTRVAYQRAALFVFYYGKRR